MCVCVCVCERLKMDNVCMCVLCVCLIYNECEDVKLMKNLKIEIDYLI